MNTIPGTTGISNVTLKPADIRSRSFLLQHMEVMNEFGEIIPWLEPLKSVTYSTNATYFRDRFLEHLGCDEEEVIPYQLTFSDDSKDYIGGIWHFPKSPENFKDRRNHDIAEKLNNEKHRYISCLQVRGPLRGTGHGREIMTGVLNEILNTHGKVWAVISNPELLPWYTSLGAKTHSPKENDDKLWIISWDKVPKLQVSEYVS